MILICIGIMNTSPVMSLKDKGVMAPMKKFCKVFTVLIFIFLYLP